MTKFNWGHQTQSNNVKMFAPVSAKGYLQRVKALLKEGENKAEDRMIYGLMMSSIWGAFFSVFVPTEAEQ